MSREQLQKALPYYIHWDGVYAYKSSGARTEYLVASWGSAIASGDCLYTKQVLCWFEVDVVRVMRTGNFPRVDLSGSAVPLAGQDFCGEYTAEWCGFKHDWKAKKELHRYFRSWQSNEICERDLATVEEDMSDVACVKLGQRAHEIKATLFGGS